MISETRLFISTFCSFYLLKMKTYCESAPMNYDSLRLNDRKWLFSASLSYPDVVYYSISIHLPVHNIWSISNGDYASVRTSAQRSHVNGLGGDLYLQLEPKIMRKETKKFREFHEGMTHFISKPFPFLFHSIDTFIYYAFMSST